MKNKFNWDLDAIVRMVENKIVDTVMLEYVKI